MHQICYIEMMLKFTLPGPEPMLLLGEHFKVITILRSDKSRTHVTMIFLDIYTLYSIDYVK